MRQIQRCAAIVLMCAVAGGWVACDDAMTRGTDADGSAEASEFTCRDLAPWVEPGDLPPDIVSETVDWCRAQVPTDLPVRVAERQFTPAEIYDAPGSGRVLSCQVDPETTNGRHFYPQVCASSPEEAAVLLEEYLPALYDPAGATLVRDEDGVFVFTVPGLDEDVVVLNCARGYGLRPISIFPTDFAETGWDVRGQLPPGLGADEVLDVLHASWFHSGYYLVAAQDPYLSGRWLVYPACGGQYSPPFVEQDGDLPVEYPGEMHVAGGAVAYNLDTGVVLISGAQAGIVEFSE